MTWQSCGNIAMNGTNGIDRDYTMIVCLDVFDFGGGAVVRGQRPGSVCWYKSTYASAPIVVQMHELGHNLGRSHSGKDVGTISVLKIDSSGETDSYVMFNGKTGANDQVPQNGDEVVIVEQSIELGGSASS
eukprot:scaffold1320_cov166-Chaetoceros_neogracile.AAC.1